MYLRLRKFLKSALSKKVLSFLTNIKKHGLIGSYDYKDKILFVLAISFTPLGLLTLTLNPVFMLSEGLSIERICNTIFAGITLFLFAIYYLSRLQKKGALVLALTFYSIAFYLICDLTSFIPYFIAGLCVVAIFCLQPNKYKGLKHVILYSFGFLIIIIAKLFGFLMIVEVANITKSSFLFLAIAIFLAAAYVILRIIIEDFETKDRVVNFLKANDLTKTQRKILLLHLYSRSVKDIEQITGISNSTYRGHKKTIIRKLELHQHWYSKDFNKKGILTTLLKSSEDYSHEPHYQ